MKFLRCVDRELNNNCTGWKHKSVLVPENEIVLITPYDDGDLVTTRDGGNYWIAGKHWFDVEEVFNTEPYGTIEDIGAVFEAF